MYQTKSRVFNYLTKTQKTALCNFLRALVKKNQEVCPNELARNFIDDEIYYFEQKNPHFVFLLEFINENSFFNDTKLYIFACKKYFDYLKKNEGLILAQKEYLKKKRLFLRDLKMKNETPTKKQISYYNSLCKKYNLDKIALASKFEAREIINGILNEHKRIDTTTD
ncbi:MAG: hypothetical protein R3Y28_00830 [Candidatus Gastranaerophilales bacterium]